MWKSLDSASHLDRFAEEIAKFNGAHPEIMPAIPYRRSLLTANRIFPCKD